MSMNNYTYLFIGCKASQLNLNEDDLESVEDFDELDLIRGEGSEDFVGIILVSEYDTNTGIKPISFNLDKLKEKSEYFSDLIYSHFGISLNFEPELFIGSFWG